MVQGCQSQTPPYLDIQEVMHLVFQAPNTLAPKTCFILLWQPAVSMSGNKGNDITGPGGGEVQSICGMPTYKHKSEEELRFEDYQLGDKGEEWHI